MPESTKPKKTRKPRKTQAVKTTNNAATKAIIKKNASNSILLKAPTEVRDNILKFIMGDQMIHIKFFNKDALEKLFLSETKDPKTAPSDGGLCAAFCVADQSEQAAYDKATYSSEDIQASEDPDTTETCKDHHEACMMCGAQNKAMTVTEPTMKRITFNNNLSVLAVCRLLYEESNSILWESNTFSFDDPESFKRFVGSMNPSQKSKFRKIHLSMDVPIDVKDPWHFEEWAKAIPGRVLTPLKNLKILHLTFNQYCIWTHSSDPGDKVPNATSQDWVTQSMKTLLGLRMLPWKDHMDAYHRKHVTVIITDDASTHSEAVTPRWSRAQKLEAAEAFRVLLADPNSAEIHKVETTAAKIEAAERKAREKKQARIKQLKSAIRELRPRVRNARNEYVSGYKTQKKWTAKREHAYEKNLKSLKGLYLSEAYRKRLTKNAKKRFDPLKERMRELKAKLAEAKGNK